MQNKEILFPEEIYSEHLKTINGIRFTRREIDVMACLLNARGTSKIASLLSIALRTVVTHIQNIMLKLECNSREGIIDFIERSYKIPLLREYYAALEIEKAFEKSLKDISRLKHKRSPSNLAIYWENENQKQILLTHLGGHLRLGGLNVEVREYTGTNKPNPTGDPYLISLLFVKKDLSISCPDLEKFNSLDLTELSNYYFAVFEILKKLLPKADINKIFATFQEYYERLIDPSKRGMIWERVSEKLESKKINFLNKILHIFQDRKEYLEVGIICISFLIVGYSIIRGKEEQGVTTYPQQVSSPRKDDSIRSDLVIPVAASFLSRAELIAEIDTKLKNQSGIQTIALIGPGGAGKTTLARLYARYQKDNVIWEINAETKQSLKESFENLAQDLAVTDGDKKALSEVKNTKNPLEREEKVIQFVKKFLRSHLSWILIFDNVEKFSDILKYFPQDFETWGQGKIILTTRDGNIENNAHVNNTIHVGELNPDQKLILFTKILNHGNKHSLTSAQLEEAKIFLENIPPFPLDISIAAYYLKATKISYAAYIEKLAQHDKDFATVQQNLLKEAGAYAKTRYGIITSCLDYIINSHKDFQDLLLFISLLDSQDIPIDLLNKYKTGTVVDRFFYTLKKYSLIINKSLHNVQTFSIHRSTQSIALAYLVKLMKLEKNKYFVEHIGTTFKDYAVEIIDKEDFPKMNLLVRHWEVFLSHSSLLTGFIIASITSELGNVYRDLGNYEKAKQLLIASIEIYKKNSYENHPCFARALGYLGSIYRDIADYEEASQFLEQSIEIYRKNSYENHPWFARTLAWLGSVYRDLGNYEKAKQFLEESVIIYRKNSYENHPWYARALACLGSIYKDTPNYEKAKQLLEEAIEIYKKNSFENHPWFARTLQLLGSVYKDQGDQEKSKQFLEESLKIYRKNSFENHPWYARALACLGATYRELGNHEKARKLLEESTIIYRKNSYENHPWFVWAMQSLGIVYRDLGNYKKAKDLFERSLKTYEKIYNKDHVNIAPTIMHLGILYMLENDMETSENLMNTALKIFQCNKHPEAYACLEGLSELNLKKSIFEANRESTKQSQKFRAQAISCLKQAIGIVKTHFPKDSPHITRIEAKLIKIEGEAD